MNDLGMMLVWSAVRVTVVLIPAAAFHCVASRRSATSGAWMATFGLALGSAIGVLSLIPWPQHEELTRPTEIAAKTPAHRPNPRSNAKPEPANGGDRGISIGIDPQGAHLVGTFDRFLSVWSNLTRARIAPLVGFRRWGTAIALVGITGAGAGLVRLLIGLWAVRLCRRRGRLISDSQILQLRDEIRRVIGCRQEVEIREVPDLTAPATAGWRRPVIMLPADWRLWNEADRRAVLAHELAHIQRWDYAAGLVARLALALQFYHPLVHWLARRMILQQELAADAIGASLAGGTDSYLLSLSRLTLEQDARSSCWPARAFLPARGTLIRRIAMLQKGSMRADMPWSNGRRLLAMSCLLGVTVGVALVRGPVLGDDNAKPSTRENEHVQSATNSEPAGQTPFDLRLVSEDMEGLIALRPAMIYRRIGRPAAILTESVAGLSPFDFRDLAERLKLDRNAPGLMHLRLEDIDWIMSSLHFRRAKGPARQEMHAIQFGHLVIRTATAFDWLRFLREWRLQFEKVESGEHVYFKIVGPLKNLFQMLDELSPCVYLPDDRTIVFDEEAAIQKMLARTNPTPPAYLAGEDWARFRDDLLVVAVNNRKSEFAKSYDLGRPDDAIVLSLFKGVDHWILGLDNADAITLRANAACHDSSSAPIASAVDSLVKMAREGLQPPADSSPGAGERAWRIAIGLIQNIRVTRSGHSVELHTDGFGTLAEIGSIVEALVKQQNKSAASSSPTRSARKDTTPKASR